MSTSKYSYLIDRFIELRDQGKTLIEIQSETGVPQLAISRALKKIGKPAGYQYIPIDYSHVTDLWWAEFTGLFLGEGYIGVNPVSLSPALQIHLRDDDSVMLHEIQSQIGGQIARSPKNKNSSPSITWQIHRWSSVYSVVIHMVQGGLHGKKLREIILMKEVCEVRFKMQWNLSPLDKQVLLEYANQIRLLKSYSSD